jgi:hypothetical protein
MDTAKPKGEVIGSINLHINSKLRISHIEIDGDGDLVSKRTIQDSLMLVFRAISHARAKRKVSGRAAAAEVARAERRDNSRLEAYKKKKAEEKKKVEEDLREYIESRRNVNSAAETKANIPITPGYTPQEKRLSPAEAKAKARAEATAKAQKLASKNAVKTKLDAKSKDKKTEKKL